MKENIVTINIASQFTTTPGARYITDGNFSGQEFRDNYLVPLFLKGKEIDKIIIILDGVEGYATSFLEEAFGGLARLYGKDTCNKKLEFVSQEDKLLIDEINEYIKNV